MIGRQVAIKMMKKDVQLTTMQIVPTKGKNGRCARKTRSGYIKVNINTKGKYAR